MKIKHYLLLTNILLSFFLILFSHLNLLNFRTSDSIFLIFLILTFALYRPGWAFVLLVGTIALECVNLAPSNWSLVVRPYQLLAFAIGASLFVRFFLKKLNFALPKLRWFDFGMILLVLLSFSSALFADDRGTALKLSLVFSSFIFIYFLGRIYIQNIDDLKRILPFFLTSSLLVIFYGIIQSWLFVHNFVSHEVMPGRPNATFQEPDWLGIYLILLISLVASFIYFLLNKKSEETNQEISNSKFLISKIFLFTFSVLSFTLLILTVSRSAWLGAILALALLLFAIFTNLSFQQKNWNFKNLRNASVFLAASFLFSLGIVKFCNLTTFELGNRFQSSGSGEQTITISCQKEIALPEKIEKLDELQNFSCRHINLEEIENEKSEDKFVTQIKRPDPNFNIRSKIYEISFSEIKKNWFWGIGWGNIGNILGPDERGATLNASNIFLEIYLATGILGFLIFTIIWIYIFLKNAWKFFYAHNPEHKTLALFIITALLGLTIANLFNSGIMLGFLWIFLAVSLDKK